MLTSLKQQIGNNLTSLVVITLFIIATYIIPALSPEFSIPYMKEDGLVESLGATFFLAASILLFISFFKTLKQKHEGVTKLKNMWLLGLALLFFVACGEEISWGQRIFNFSTPESIMEKNRQHEFNLHNLEPFHGLDDKGERKTGLEGWMTMHRMFYVVLFGYIVIIPFIMVFNNMLSRLINNLGIPTTPIWISLIFLVVIFLVKIIQFAFARNNTELYHGLVEVMESNIAFVAMLIGLSLYQNPQGQKNSSVS